MPQKWIKTISFGSGHTLGTFNHGLEPLFCCFITYFGEAPIRCLDSVWLGDQFVLKRCIKSLSGCRFSNAVEALEQGWKDSWFLSKFAAFFRPDPDFRRYWKGFLRWNGVQYFSTKFAANTWKLSNPGETSEMKLNLRSQVWDNFW